MTDTVPRRLASLERAKEERETSGSTEVYEGDNDGMGAIKSDFDQRSGSSKSPEPCQYS